MTEVYLGLGSNVGCKTGNIKRAIRKLEETEGIELLETSSFYKTAPVGVVDQDWFVNAAVKILTKHPARSLLDICLSIEMDLKRVRDQRWGPRTIDIDIVFYGKEEMAEEYLQVPHPQFRERAFVLEPMLEIDPNLEWKGSRLSDMLHALPRQAIEVLKPVVAILGASSKPERYSNQAQKLLTEKGYEVAPISPREESVLGLPAFQTLIECRYPVDTVTLYVGSSKVISVLDDILAMAPLRVIFNPGTENTVVRDALDKAGIETIEGCTLVMLRTASF